VLPGEKARDRLHFRVAHEDVRNNRDLLKELSAAAYEEQQD